MLELTRYDHLRLFKKDVLGYLEQYEVENNLILGVLHSLSTDATPTFMATATVNQGLALVMLQTHPRQIILSRHLINEEDEVKRLAKQLVSVYPSDIPGLIGENKLTKRLADEIVKLTDCDLTINMNQRIYRLDEVKKEAAPTGVLRIVEREDLPLIKNWVYQFCEEVDMAISYEEAEEKAIQFIEKGTLHAWVMEGRCVAMAAASRPTKTNINISLVYTPKQERKKGYASSCVSALTTMMLEQGYKSTSLYTDLANPTSNKIYMEIGYTPIMDSIAIHFS
ncbi:GNAT family N-acetyltransferase [Bacillus sp. PS06]|uniref:GNAT family N-acetyltransferase n=1 Tax=Bacillus sp. PS06 TaxID=2764176 RepID=UPI00177EE9A3|nr:GNAT family N-acetyltransferase [Bacillus sp. PS06]MBD8070879.1 GNAT family N-acetyltransferase [Bacillus sp. PS06]